MVVWFSTIPSINNDNRSAREVASSSWMAMTMAIGTVVLTHATWRMWQLRRRRRDVRDDRYDDNIDTDDLFYENLLNETNRMTKEEVSRLRVKHFSKTLSISYSNTSPLMLTKGRGCYLYEPAQEGQEEVQTPIRPHFLDTRNNVAHVGHCHPQLLRVVSHQLAQINTNTRYLHPITTALAQRLLQTFPQPPPENSTGEKPLTKVFFCNSGSEANDLALRLTRAYSLIQQQKRQQQLVQSRRMQRENNHNSTHISLIVIDHAYHGHTIATLDISPYKYAHSSEYYCDNTSNNSNNHSGMKEIPSLSRQSHRSRPSFRVQSVPCPNMYRGLYTTTTFKHNHWYNPGKLYAQHIEEICRQTQNNGNDDGCIGIALMIESGMSVGGVILPPKNYIYHAVQAVRSVDGLYIADEIQTGLGRYGSSCYWGFQYNQDDHKHVDDADDNNDQNLDPRNTTDEPLYLNPIPDIVTMGKGFGNGMPIAAVVCNDKVNRAFEELLGTVEVFNTFGGNPVCASAAFMVLNILEREQLQKNATLVGTYLIHELKVLQQQQQVSYIGDVRGCGLFIGIEFVLDPIAKIPATKLVSWICSTMKDTYRIITSIDGPGNNVLVIKPPMVFNMSDANQFVSSLQNVLFVDLPNYIAQNHDSTVLQVTTGGKTAEHTPT